MGKRFSLCLNVILLESGSKEGRVLKLLVEVDLNKPLLRGIKIKLEDEQIWVDFSYEQLPMFCFYCGCIGHSERFCEMKMRDSRDGNVCEGQYGEWLRVMLPRGDRMGEKAENWLKKKGEQVSGIGLNVNSREGYKTVEVGIREKDQAKLSSKGNQ